MLNVQLAPTAEHDSAADETPAKKRKKAPKTLATAGTRRSKDLEPGEKLLGFFCRHRLRRRGSHISRQCGPAVDMSR